MTWQKLLYWLLAIISVSTLISGVNQTIDPAFILRKISAEVTPNSEQCIGTIGMFMALFGGMLLQVLLNPTHLSQQPPSPIFLWAGLQKLGASIAVGIGVSHGVFGRVALLVASFDLLSGILIFLYLRLLKRQVTP
jgi:hypothetical protein